MLCTGRGNYSKRRPLAAAGAPDLLHSWHDSCMIARIHFCPFRVCWRDNGFGDSCMCIGLLTVSRGLHEAIICDKLWRIKSVKDAMRWCFSRKVATFIPRSLIKNRRHFVFWLFAYPQGKSQQSLFQWSKCIETKKGQGYSYHINSSNRISLSLITNKLTIIQVASHNNKRQDTKF